MDESALRLLLNAWRSRASRLSRPAPSQRRDEGQHGQCHVELVSRRRGRRVEPGAQVVVIIASTMSPNSASPARRVRTRSHRDATAELDQAGQDGKEPSGSKMRGVRHEESPSDLCRGGRDPGTPRKVSRPRSR